MRTDLPGRPAVPARIDMVIPSQRRTTIRQGAATVEMIEHVMAALAGLRIDNCIIQIDASECPGCDGSSQAFVEVLDRAGIVEQDRMRQALVLEQSVSVRRRGRRPGGTPRRAGGLTLSYHLDYGQESPISTQSFCLALSPQTRFVTSWPPAAHFCWSRKPALRAAGIGARTTAADLLIFGPTGLSATHCVIPTSACGTRSSTWWATWLSWVSISTGLSSRTGRDIRPTTPWRVDFSSWFSKTTTAAELVDAVRDAGSTCLAGTAHRVATVGR